MEKTLHKIVNGQPVPLTQEEIDEFNALEAEYAAQAAQREIDVVVAKRMGEYPSIQEIVIAMTDAIRTNPDAFPKDTKMAEVLAKQEAVKAKYPKPEVK